MPPFLVPLRPLLPLLIVGLGGIVATSWGTFRRWERTHRALMAAFACLGLWAFTTFGEFHDHGSFGHHNFHAHDAYHYYFGSKYFKEFGYYDMYVATVAALEEIGREEPTKSIRFDRIRDLRGSARFMYRDEYAPQLDTVKARFSPGRWSDFKREMSFLRGKTMNTDWWHGVMLDNGFNPPPSYAVLSGAVSNRIPLNETTWTWIGGLDFLLIGIGVGAICYAFGPVPALFVLVVMGNAPVTTYNWTGGSFLRQVWFFFLMIGLASLARRRWYAAGASLGACTAVVFFPLLFLFGAMVPLGYRAVRTGNRVPVTRVAIGAAVAIATLIGLSLVVYGPGPWSEWHHRISAHDLTFFDNHIGIKKVVTFAREVGRQAFAAGDTVYPEWNRALNARAYRGRIVDLALAVVLSVWTIAGALRSRPAEACLVVGSGLLVFWTMPAGYYTIYVGAFAGVMLANRGSSWGRARFAVLFATLVAAILMRRYEGDLITQSFFLSVGWIACILVLSTLGWLWRPAFELTARQQGLTVGAMVLLTVALVLAGPVWQARRHDAAFMPPPLLGQSTVGDVLDVGPPASESAHHLQIAESRRVPRDLMDIYGYLVKDDCGILRNGGVATYTLAPAPRGGRLVVRTDAFYAGDLLTTVNGRSMPAVKFTPHQSLFTYLQVQLPADLGDEPLHVTQTTTATDVGLFTVWLLRD